MSSNGFPSPISFSRCTSPEIEAERVRHEADLGDQVPVDLKAICEFHDFGVEFCDVPESFGRARLGDEGQAIIQVRKGMDVGVTRFTIAHEIGHWILHRDEELKAQMRDPRNPYGHITDKKLEREADAFAAALLFPKMPFKAAVVESSVCIATIQDLADLYRASFTATAIRFAKETDEMVAFVMASGDDPRGYQVQYLERSESFAAHRLFIEPGTPLPINSNAYGLLNQGSYMSMRISAKHWFPRLDNPRQRLHDEPKLISRFNQVGSLLWIQELVED